MVRTGHHFNVAPTMHDDDRFIGLSDSALALWVLCGSFCVDHILDAGDTDGTVSVARAARLRPFSYEDAAKELVKAGLWQKLRGRNSGWKFINWAQEQQTKDERAAYLHGERGRKKKTEPDPKTPNKNGKPRSAAKSSARNSDRNPDGTPTDVQPESTPESDAETPNHDTAGHDHVSGSDPIDQPKPANNNAEPDPKTPIKTENTRSAAKSSARNSDRNPDGTPTERRRNSERLRSKNLETRDTDTSVVGHLSAHRDRATAREPVDNSQSAVGDSGSSRREWRADRCMTHQSSERAPGDCPGCRDAARVVARDAAREAARQARADRTRRAAEREQAIAECALCDSLGQRIGQKSRLCTHTDQPRSRAALRAASDADASQANHEQQQLESPDQLAPGVDQGDAGSEHTTTTTAGQPPSAHHERNAS